ncbi:MAG: 2-amino-4-hydroxy-6-hydroxymethyldihydropteridine diphosphokinase [Lachnospiraceae bacterium]|jgi:dihydroneopterin aldolase/2-amino-4-hydroxy-6-hydroxymethyldihydropteridine diphosphokinase|nr:2-amino-4-hydroxy-6-hydroxymethyldihydropteridine diphosphokinase [Lachnospiraceae bacterium]MCR5700587.1 2-amino-4-hydroxy-6-hydroxymethyldihydropteridine diphosphokinase [Lachnospiraceae bacterium]
MDKIYIENLELFGHHGVLEQEQVLGQKFIVCATLFLDTRKAGKTDYLKESLDYSEVCRKIKEIVERQRFLLIERVAETIAETLLLTYEQLFEVEITVKKPWAPVLEHLDTVSVTIKRKWHKAYLSIGSNIGDREGYLDMAVDYFNNEYDTKVTAVADYIETKPYGDVEQEDFLNGALEIVTLKTPRELLETAMAIEKEAHRERLVHWGPRTLDVDILFYDDEIIMEEDLKIPHVEIPKREFVLEPLNSIAPYYMHPVLHKSVAEMLENLKK